MVKHKGINYKLSHYVRTFPAELSETGKEKGDQVSGKKQRKRNGKGTGKGKGQGKGNGKGKKKKEGKVKAKGRKGKGKKKEKGKGTSKEKGRKKPICFHSGVNLFLANGLQ